MTQPSLTIVIAAWPDLAGLEPCLQAVAPQRDATTEVIVVARVAFPRTIADRFPWVCWRSAPSWSLTPHLWAEGMRQARGEVIALTTSQFLPATDWAQRIGQAYSTGLWSAVGGRIDPPRRQGATAWATYFLRYSAYLNYDRPQPVPDLAGDNAAYRREALDRHPAWQKNGFWEQDLHQALRAEGEELRFDPAIRVVQQGSLGFWCFIGQRWRHGQQFGQTRMCGRSLAFRAAGLLAAPLVPAVLLARIVGRVARSRRDFGPFLLALPLLLCFVLAWATGEACGYARTLWPRASIRRPGRLRPAIRATNSHSEVRS